jgi:hypothetical protein
MKTRLAMSGAKTAFKLKQHAPAILVTTGIGCMVGATVMACRATSKANVVMDEYEREKDIQRRAHEVKPEEYTAEDMEKEGRASQIRAASKIARAYMPTVALTIVGIACITRSHHILNRRNAALTAAYGALERTFKEYRNQVVKQYGEDKDLEFKYEAERVMAGEPGSEKEKDAKTILDKSQYARWFDDSSRNWKKEEGYNTLFLEATQRYMNNRLQTRGHVFLNEVYDALDLPRTRAGQVVGWYLSEDGTTDNYVDFGVFDPRNPYARNFVNGNEPYILLDFNVDGVIHDKLKD